MTPHQYDKATRTLRWWYEALADFIIANPNANQNDMSAHFGRRPATISTVIGTDAFKAYFRQRRNAHAEKLDAEVRHKLFKVTNKSLDHMLEVLDKKRDNIPIEILRRVNDSALKNLGYGISSPPGGTTVNVNTTPQHVHVAVSLDDLEAARAALRAAQGPLIDATPDEKASEASGATPVRTYKSLEDLA
jgi:hypothetical protein